MADQVTERALKIAAERFGWNQREFADAIGVDKQHVTNWLARGMPASRHAKVAAALRITIEELLTGTAADEDSRLFADLHRAWRALSTARDRQELVNYAKFKAGLNAEKQPAGFKEEQQQARAEGPQSEVDERAVLRRRRRTAP